MARIPLSESNFKVVSEGEHVFTVKSVDYKPDFGKLALKLVTEGNEFHTENFVLTNDKALFAFTMTAKALMGDNSIKDIDPEELVGKKMVATVEHTVSDKGNTFARLTDKKPASAATNEPEEADLDDLFDL